MSTIVRLDKIGNDTRIVSGVLASDLENGRVVKRGALRADKESFDCAAPVDITADDLYFHASVPLQYDETKNDEDFILKAGKAGRMLKLGKGAIVTITDDGITGATVVGQYVVPANAATKMAASATVGTANFVFEVIDKENLHGYAATVLKVIKA